MKAWTLLAPVFGSGILLGAHSDMKIDAVDGNLVLAVVVLVVALAIISLVRESKAEATG